MKNFLKNVVNIFTSNSRKGTTGVPFQVLFGKFQDILTINNKILEQIAEVNDKLGGNYIFDKHYIETTCRDLADLSLKLIHDLDAIAPQKYVALYDAFRRISAEIEKDLGGRSYCLLKDFVLPYDAIGHDDTETVGGKNNNLAQLQNFLGLRIPQGFAITSTAFEAFIDYNNLRAEIKHNLENWNAGNFSLEDCAEKIQKRILESPLPSKLEKAISSGLSQLAVAMGHSHYSLAVRSSAWGEDGERSFAGQYESVLNVQPADLADAYRKVVASTYSANAIGYRQKIGFPEEDVIMSVACQVMIDTKISGVLYTLDPLQNRADYMQLSAAWGLGIPIVSGSASGDRFTVDRIAPHRIRNMQLVRKEKALHPRQGGGTTLSPVEKNQQTQSCLTNSQINEIAGIGMMIEKYFKKPQDIEFAIDNNGQLFILQARSLHISPPNNDHAPDFTKILQHHQIILRDKGDIAQKGIASGTVWHFSEESRAEDIPMGAIVVARFASPLLAKVMARSGAIITDVGSTTGHLATIAREFRVPCILNTQEATKLLPQGAEVTVDADANIIYRGIVNELCLYDLAEDPIEETTEYRLLRRILKNIAPLNLIDPMEKNFTPDSCKTLHDITRFVHEKAVEELVDQNYYSHYDTHRTRKLVWNIPLDLVFIDIGGGLTPDLQKKGGIARESVLSVPMKAILSGIAHPGIWNSEPMSVDMKSFMSSLTRTFSPELASPRYVGQNLAVISGEYANLSLRLGYHFTMIDSYVTDNINDNYAYFRFFGGVTDHSRRSRRAKFLGTVLSLHDFRVEIHGDLVVARIKKLDRKGMLQRLHLLGQLVSFTRQLDVKMVSEEHISQYINKFNLLKEEVV